MLRNKHVTKFRIPPASSELYNLIEINCQYWILSSRFYYPLDYRTKMTKSCHPRLIISMRLFLLLQRHEKNYSFQFFPVLTDVKKLITSTTQNTTAYIISLKLIISNCAERLHSKMLMILTIVLITSSPSPFQFLISSKL